MENLERHVRKGEKAIWILAPITRKIREEDDHGKIRDKVIVSGFKSVPVFNVSQTDGADLPAPWPTMTTGHPSHEQDPREARAHVREHTS